MKKNTTPHFFSMMIARLALCFLFACAVASPADAAEPKGKPVKAKVVKAKKTKKARSVKKAASAPVSFTEDSRFAAYVIDADTGRVLYEKNAQSTRYPASLTKMMTLYLLFEALEEKRIGMGDSFPVSAKAASQPPTNISLSPGDRVPVKTAIEALIIRSANDVAMVVAEGLGGTQWDFALRMNKKARELGMRNTTFYNPSGLPDSRQVTTAADLAQLGIALKRDFPQYYRYFSQRSFSFKGRTYQGHNRLLGKYPGADGIKTGFINASGFNLVTSVTRGNSHLVGVVMGGRTGAGRDQEMMSMLDRTFIQLAHEGTGQKAVAALPRNRPQPEEPPTRASEAAQQTVIARREEKPLPQPSSQPSRLNASQLNWSIQVGSFPQEEEARSALASARQLAGNATGAAEEQVKGYSYQGKPYYRARLSGLTGDQARDACAALSANNRQCLLVRASN